MSSDDAFVTTVEARMRAVMEGTPAARPALPLLDAGGKRLRARLVWWSAIATVDAPRAADDSLLVHAAAAIELAHLGSLIHDDVVDGAETRRGVATLHRVCGVTTAVDAGAAIAHLANEIVAGLGPRIRRAVRRALLATCRGQIRELAVPFVAISPRRRLAIMQEKTGAFFELAASLGAIVAGADVRAFAAIRRFGRRFGVAFQIADDVLDLTGDPAELGRANGSDLRDGVLTLPVLLAADPEKRLSELLAQIRTTPDAATIAHCIDTIVAGGGTEAAAAVASWWLHRALGALAALPESEALTRLRALASAGVERGLHRSCKPSTAPAGVRPPPIAEVTPDWRLIESRYPLTAGGCAMPERLAALVEWFHPGLSAMIAARARDGGIAANRARLRRRLAPEASKSLEGAVATEATALAHALADPRFLREEPVRTLALVDALHCAAIALLALAPSAREHRVLAARARTVSARPPERSRPRPEGGGRAGLATSTVQLSA